MRQIRVKWQKIPAQTLKIDWFGPVTAPDGACGGQRFSVCPQQMDKCIFVQTAKNAAASLTCGAVRNPRHSGLRLVSLVLFPRGKAAADVPFRLVGLQDLLDLQV